MNKKALVVISVIVAIVIATVVFLITRKDTQPVNGTEFKIYSIDKIQLKDSSANLILLDSLNGGEQTELHLKENDTYTISEDLKPIKVLKLTNDYITISIAGLGLAPTKQDGTISLLDSYKEITINKNTGVHLNVQATDTSEGFYVFYNVK